MSIFVSMFIGVLAYDFLSLWHPCLVMVSGLCWPREVSLECSLLLFLEGFEKDPYHFFECLVEFTSQSSWS